MAEFIVHDILAYNMIRTQKWEIEKDGGEPVIGEHVVVRGIPKLSDDFDKHRAKSRLSVILKGKKCSLLRAVLVNDYTIECDVFVDGYNVDNFYNDFRNAPREEPEREIA